MAFKMGLPDGLTVTVDNNCLYKFTGPGGDPIINTKKSLISYFGFNLELKVKTLSIAMTNDGDPKWRTSGNIYLGVRLLFSPNNGEVNLTNAEELCQLGFQKMIKIRMENFEKKDNNNPNNFPIISLRDIVKKHNLTHSLNAPK